MDEYTEVSGVVEHGPKITTVTMSINYPPPTHYDVTVKCENCGYKGRVSITIGHLVGQKSCPRCGCTALKRAGFWS